ncbi:alpha/beta fold hydrolase [Streptomyces hygroscopicus]|uniref:alpha/beta fold hydrolase n=1 Tax=Streptomyces hygroscopicus TaxID=1912 RepID=UPI0007679E7D|nr:alpha/beta hydrolase [Streptomyces hygroscopicus]GLV73583.1 putative hydrolase, alpha/beta fold family protein [Streptomyces hygroscopicus subsp. hygroscopicus]
MVRRVTTKTVPSPDFVTLRGRRFALTDFGGPGAPVLALHGHFGRGRMYAPLAAALAPEWRVIALDQRGHGLTGGGGPFTLDEYVADAAALLRELRLGPVPVVAHSTGAVGGYALAARHPDLVSALVVEDIGAVTDRPVVSHPVLDVSNWPTWAVDREKLRAAIESRGIPDASYFLDSAEPDPQTGGWRLLFEPSHMMASQQAMCGDFWDDWLGSSCPALLMRGEHSPLLPPGHAHEMADRRPNTRLREFAGCGHWIHDDAPREYARAVRSFLNAL